MTTPGQPQGASRERLAPSSSQGSSPPGAMPGDTGAPPWARRLLAGVAAVGLALLAAATPARADASQPDWAAKPYEYMVVDQDLRTVLEEYGRNVGVRVILSTAVQGRVRGNLPRSSARAFLDTLARNYGLDWYHDGFAIHVSGAAEAKSRLLELHGVPFATVVEGIKAAGLFDGRFQLQAGPTPAMVLVAGPPRYVELVVETIAAMSKKPGIAPQPPSVMHVYRGAAAVDNISFQDRKSE